MYFKGLLNVFISRALKQINNLTLFQSPFFQPLHTELEFERNVRKKIGNGHESSMICDCSTLGFGPAAASVDSAAS